jgi:hypothetical protein
VLDKRVKALVPGNDMEVGVGFRHRESAYVIGNVEIEGIRPLTADLDITAIGTQRMDGSHYWDVDPLLICTKKDHNPKMIVLELFNGLRLRILRVNQNYVSAQSMPPTKRITSESIARCDFTHYSSPITAFVPAISLGRGDR